MSLAAFTERSFAKDTDAEAPNPAQLPPALTLARDSEFTKILAVEVKA
jgi:hypothetical protein